MRELAFRESFVYWQPMVLSSKQALLRQQIRNKIRQQRRSLSPHQQQSAAQYVASHLIHHIKIQQAQHIAAFLSFDGELPTQLIIEQLWQQQKHVYLPVLHPFSPGNLLFLHYNATTPLVANRLQIREPQLDVRRVIPLTQLDVILTPLVAFDRHGQRLGMGRGFYDRTLQHCWPQQGPYPIGLAHDCQLVNELPIEHWDIPLPEIVTPSQIWQS